MRKMGGGKQMKLGILCTHDQWIWQKRILQQPGDRFRTGAGTKGHEVMIYKGIDPQKKRKGPGGKKSDHLVSSHEASGSARLYGL